MDKDFSIIEEMLGIPDRAAFSWEERVDERKALSKEDMASYLHLTYNSACELYVSGEYEKARDEIDSVIHITGIDNWDNKDFPIEYYGILVKLEQLMVLCLLKQGLYDDATNLACGASMNLYRYDNENNHERAKANYLCGIAFYYAGQRYKVHLEEAKRQLEQESERIKGLIHSIDSYLSEGNN